MVYSIEKENVIYLWWDDRKEFVDGCFYRVTVDNKSVVYTKDRLYDFKNIDMQTLHTFAIDVLDKGGNKLGQTETYTNKEIFKNKTPINVTLPPYNAIGDGVHDCTQSIQKAFEDCDSSKYVYFPFGVYYCSKIFINDEVKIVFDTGAIITNCKEVDKLC
jgi:polygalacturonase